MNILAVIPARGNSKGIPRKNVRILNGEPLIAYAIQNAQKSKFKLDICVTTDNGEISKIAERYNAKVIKRKNSLAEDNVTLDPVIFDAFSEMEQQKGIKYDLIITLQATSPLLKTSTLDKAIEKIIEDKTIDSIISVVDRPHLSWTRDENGEMKPQYKERVNRQYLPPNYVETGAFLISRADIINEKSRIGSNLYVYEVDENEAIDIDTPHDWWIAEGELSKKNIIIRVEGYSDIGLGHVYRGLTLAYGLIHHNIRFVTSEHSNLAINKLEESFFPYTILSDEKELFNIINEYEADIIINDMLNTSYEYISMLKNTGIKVVSFEDLGEGTKYCDIVINDLYAPQGEFEGNQYYWGSDYYLLRDEFLMSKPSIFKEKVTSILIIFGGVDPSNLTEKVLNSLKYVEKNEEIKFTFVVGPGYSNMKKLKSMRLPENVQVVFDVKVMSDLMIQSDIAISSQGRTMLELAAMGVPTILLAQNKRELTHEFGSLNNGYINLGLGNLIKPNSIASTLNWLIATPDIRKEMRRQMLSRELKLGLDRVIKLILS